MSVLRDQTAIVGIGESEYSFKSDKGVKELILEAVEAALDDAKIRPEDVDGIVTEGVMMPRMFPLDEMAAYLGTSSGYTGEFSHAGAGIVGAILPMAMAIKSGVAHTVLSYFGIDWGSFPSNAAAYHNYPTKVCFEKPFGYYGQATYLAVSARRYMHDYGLTTRQLAAIAITEREHAILNKKALLKQPLSYEEYEKSPMVASPLREADCFVPADGAVAFIMTSAEQARNCPKLPVYVSGVGFAGDPITAVSFHTQRPDLGDLPAIPLATSKALAMAGMSLADIDFAEIYDCYTISCLLQFEGIGFCKKGEGGSVIESGYTSLRGALPVNTHGGMLSQAYIQSANHIIECVRQLRGEAEAAQVHDAEVGLISGLGSYEHAIAILRKG